MAVGLTLPDKKGKVSETNPLPISIVEGEDILDLVEKKGLSSIPVFIVNEVGDYMLCDKDLTATPNHYGYVNNEGKWHILEETIAGSIYSYRYAKGDSDYETNWNNKTNLSYDYFFNL